MSDASSPMRPLRDLHLAAVFLTRLPLPRLRGETRRLAACMWAFPVVGAVLGLVGGLGYGLALWAGLPSPAAALLAVGALVLASGALHEDGLADVADGFGGGTTRTRKLEILRDSRIGSYGVIALVLSLGLRVVAVAGMSGAGDALAALVVAAACGRGALPLAMRLVRPARPDGLGASAGEPDNMTLLVAVLIPLALALILWPAHFLGIAFWSLAAVVAVCWLAYRQIGGYTGDVLGAAAQAVEVAVLLVLLAGVTL